MGMPKALLSDERGIPLTWLTAERLLHAGCAEVVVVLGAESDQAQHLYDAVEPRLDGVTLLRAPDWAEGMGASLRAGLRHLVDHAAAPATLVTLVDLPDVGVEVLRRVIGAWAGAGAGPDALVRATYGDTPGHPVLLGRDHWVALCGTLRGDTGAQPYLSTHKVVHVACEDLATGRDLDEPADLDRGLPGVRAPRHD